MLATLSSADAAEQLNNLEPEQSAGILAALPQKQAIRILELPELNDTSQIICLMPLADAVRLLNHIGKDHATDIFQNIEDESIRAQLMANLEPQARLSVQRLMQYPPRTAGSLMTTDFVSVPSTWTVGQALEKIRTIQRASDMVYVVYVLNAEDGTLEDAITLRRLIAGAPEEPILSIAAPHDVVFVHALDDQTEVARQIRRHNVLALPVVDEQRHIIGIVAVDDVIDAMIDEGTEDTQKFGGMESLGKPYMQIGFTGMIRKRAGWLAALFMGEMLTASAMQHYELALEQAIVLSLFIPLIMSSGGNSGSQATSLIIRGLALGEIKLSDWWRILLREMPMGVSLGLILGLIGITRIVFWQQLGFYDYGEHWLLLSLTIGLALVGIVTFGSMVGSMLPFIMQRIGFDPASASAPFVATLVDVTGIIIYFNIAILVLSGTLL